MPLAPGSTLLSQNSQKASSASQLTPAPHSQLYTSTIMENSSIFASPPASFFQYAFLNCISSVQYPRLSIFRPGQSCIKHSFSDIRASGLLTIYSTNKLYKDFQTEYNYDSIARMSNCNSVQQPWLLLCRRCAYSNPMPQSAMTPRDDSSSSASKGWHILPSASHPLNSPRPSLDIAIYAV